MLRAVGIYLIGATSVTVAEIVSWRLFLCGEEVETRSRRATNTSDLMKKTRAKVMWWLLFLLCCHCVRVLYEWYQYRSTFVDESGEACVLGCVLTVLTSSLLDEMMNLVVIFPSAVRRVIVATCYMLLLLLTRITQLRPIPCIGSLFM